MAEGLVSLQIRQLVLFFLLGLFFPPPSLILLPITLFLNRLSTYHQDKVSFTHHKFPFIIMSESKDHELSEDGSNSSSSLLLPDPQDYGYEEDIHSKKKARTWLRPIYIHILILVSYTILFISMAKSLRGQNCHPDMIFCKFKIHLLTYIL